MPTNSFHIILLVTLQIIQEWEGCNSGLQGDQSVVETDAHLDVSNTVAGGKREKLLRSSVWGVLCSLFQLVWCPSIVHKLKSKVIALTYKSPPMIWALSPFLSSSGAFPSKPRLKRATRYTILASLACSLSSASRPPCGLTDAVPSSWNAHKLSSLPHFQLHLSQFCSFFRAKIKRLLSH